MQHTDTSTPTTDAPTIRHPSWCVADQDAPRILDDGQYEAPAD